MDDLELLREQRAELFSVSIKILEESFAGPLVFEKGLIIGVIENLTFEKFPESLDEVQIW